jgi:hypothetical protein
MCLRCTLNDLLNMLLCDPIKVHKTLSASVLHRYARAQDGPRNLSLHHHNARAQRRLQCQLQSSTTSNMNSPWPHHQVAQPWQPARARAAGIQSYCVTCLTSETYQWLVSNTISACMQSCWHLHLGPVPLLETAVFWALVRPSSNLHDLDREITCHAPSRPV